MSYTYDMTLSKRSTYGYTLENQNGIVVYEFSAHNDSEAMRIAQAWMSSWYSVRITLKGEDGQQQKRD